MVSGILDPVPNAVWGDDLSFVSKNSSKSEATKSAKSEGQQVIECDYNENCTKLYKRIENATNDDDWDEVIQFIDNGCSRFAEKVKLQEESMTWITQYDSKEDNVYNWRQLPLHLAIVRRAPFAVTGRLIELYPQSVRCTDDQGMLPIHLALDHEATDDIVNYLLLRFPASAKFRGKDGRTPGEIVEGKLQKKLRTNKTSINKSPLAQKKTTIDTEWEAREEQMSSANQIEFRELDAELAVNTTKVKRELILLRETVNQALKSRKGRIPDDLIAMKESIDSISVSELDIANENQWEKAQSKLGILKGLLAMKKKNKKKRKSKKSKKREKADRNSAAGMKSAPAEETESGKASQISEVVSGMSKESAKSLLNMVELALMSEPSGVGKEMSAEDTLSVEEPNTQMSLRSSNSMTAPLPRLETDAANTKPETLDESNTCVTKNLSEERKGENEPNLEQKGKSKTPLWTLAGIISPPVLRRKKNASDDASVKSKKSVKTGGASVKSDGSTYSKSKNGESQKKVVGPREEKGGAPDNDPPTMKRSESMKSKKSVSSRSVISTKSAKAEAESTKPETSNAEEEKQTAIPVAAPVQGNESSGRGVTPFLTVKSDAASVARSVSSKKSIYTLAGILPPPCLRKAKDSTKDDETVISKVSAKSANTVESKKSTQSKLKVAE